MEPIFKMWRYADEASSADAFQRMHAALIDDTTTERGVGLWRTRRTDDATGYYLIAMDNGEQHDAMPVCDTLAGNGVETDIPEEHQQMLFTRHMRVILEAALANPAATSASVRTPHPGGAVLRRDGTMQELA